MPVNVQWQATDDYLRWQEKVEELRRLKADGATPQTLQLFRDEKVVPLRETAFATKQRLLAGGASQAQGILRIPQAGSSEMDDE